MMVVVMGQNCNGILHVLRVLRVSYVYAIVCDIVHTDMETDDSGTC